MSEGKKPGAGRKSSGRGQRDLRVRVKTAKGTELQPRNRGRDASSAWVRKTAQDLDPNLLGKSPRADSGAPIVGPDSKRP